MHRIRFRRLLPIIHLGIAIVLMTVAHLQHRAWMSEIENCSMPCEATSPLESDYPTDFVLTAVNLPAFLLIAPILYSLPETYLIAMVRISPVILTVPMIIPAIFLWYLLGRWLDRRYDPNVHVPSHFNNKHRVAMGTACVLAGILFNLWSDIVGLLWHITLTTRVIVATWGVLALMLVSAQIAEWWRAARRTT